MTKEEKIELRKLRQEAFKKRHPNERLLLLKDATEKFIKILDEIGVCNDQYIYLLLALIENATVAEADKFNVTLVNLKEDNPLCTN